MEKKKLSIESLLRIGEILLFLFAIEMLLATPLFLFGLGISWLFMVVSFVVAVGATYLLNNKSISWIDVLTCVLLVVVFACIGGALFDTSWDGNAYHKSAIGLLKNQWNPLYTMPSMAITEGDGVSASHNMLWVEAYCKVTWIFGAGIYSLFGNIETAKCYTMIAMVAVFALVYYYMRKKDYSIFAAVVMASISAINPISVQQMFTFYVDGFLCSMLILVVLSLLMMEEPEIFDIKTSSCLLVASMIICGNIKFTGLLYGGIFCIAYYLYDFVKLFRHDEKWLSKIVKESAFYAFVLFITMIWAGSSSYVTNFIRHGSITYPLTGNETEDVITAQAPFPDVNHFKNVIISTFSRVDNIKYTTGTPELKIPFTFNMHEVSVASKYPDTRVAGFGVFFGGLLIVSVVVLVAWLIRTENSKKKQLVILNLITCTFLTFGNSASWCARYAPYLYMILLLATVVLLGMKNDAKVKILVCFVLVATLFNNALPMVGIKNRIKKTHSVAKEFEDLKSHGDIEIYNIDFEGVYFNFKDQGVSYRANEALGDDENVNITKYQKTSWR